MNSRVQAIGNATSELSRTVEARDEALAAVSKRQTHLEATQPPRPADQAAVREGSCGSRGVCVLISQPGVWGSRRRVRQEARRTIGGPGECPCAPVGHAAQARADGQAAAAARSICRRAAQEPRAAAEDAHRSGGNTCALRQLNSILSPGTLDTAGVPATATATVSAAATAAAAATATVRILVFGAFDRTDAAHHGSRSGLRDIDASVGPHCFRTQSRPDTDASPSARACHRQVRGVCVGVCHPSPTA